MTDQTHDVTLTVAIGAALFSSLAAAAYTVMGVEPSPVVGLFFSAGPLFAVIFWLQKDARRTGVGAVHDWGYFLLLAWPFVIPWYAFRTRGLSGWLLALGLIGLIVAAPLTSFSIPWVIYLVKYLAWYLL